MLYISLLEVQSLQESSLYSCGNLAPVDERLELWM